MRIILKCLNCGSESQGSKRKYCDITCSRRYNNRKRLGYDLSVFELVPPVSHKSVILKCLSCSASFKRAKNGGSDGMQYTRYCSSKCGMDHRSMVIGEINAIKRIASRDKNLFNYKISERTKRIIGIDHEIAKHNHCRTCGDNITQESSQCCKRFCDSCRESVRLSYIQLDSTKDAVRANRRDGRRSGTIPRGADKSRAKHYGVEYESVSRSIVFNKAKWCCQQCGVSTPLEMKGKSKPNSPELDHVIPISKGGSHTYGNVQLLCRSCNRIKSDNVYPVLLSRGTGG